MSFLYWVVEYLASFIEIMMCCIFCGTFLMNEKLNKKNVPIVLFSLAGSVLILILNNIEIFSFINSYIAIILFFVIQLVLYKPFKWAHIWLVFIYTIILSALDFTTGYLAALTLNTNISYLLTTQGTERLICILLSKTLLLLTVTTFNKIFKRSFKFISKYILTTCIYSVFLLGMIFVMLELNMHTMNKTTEFLMVTFFIASIVIEIAMFYFVITLTEAQETEQQMQLIELKNNMLQKSLDETEQTFKLWRSSVHDYKNNIIALSQLANDGDLDKLKLYLNEKNELLNRQMFYIKTGNSSVDALIYSKQRYAKDNNIKFIVNAYIPKECVINDIDITIILGNLIDNAFEASTMEDEPYVDIDIKLEKEFLVIRISNKYSHTLSNNFATHKDNKIMHGIGLSSVKNTVHKYNGEFNIEQSLNTVVASVVLINK